MCSTWAPGVQVCFTHASLSALRCAAVIVRHTTLNTGIDDPDCARALQLCTSGKWSSHFFFHHYFFSFKWQIANYGGRESSTPCRLRRHTANRRDAWKFKRDFEHRSPQFDGSEERNAPKRAQHQQLRRIFAKFATHALRKTHHKYNRAFLQWSSWPAHAVNSCSRLAVFANALVICAHFFGGANQSFNLSNHVFLPCLFSEVVPRWALLAAVAVTDGKDDNSSDEQWSNCTLQCRRLITLGTHLRRLRRSSNCALDALTHWKYCMIKKCAIWITFYI